MKSVVEFNRMSGNLHPDLGKLPNIERMLLSSNNFTGEIPESFSNLVTLTDFRISDNQFSGTIPKFIQKWKKLEKLVIHASGLSGPIPYEISSLTELSDLRMSDLNGPEYSSFPRLNNMKNLKTLILRSCNINGSIPAYLGQLQSLETIDLSFNKLSGVVPSSFNDKKKLPYLFLNGNQLSGSLPDWILKDSGHIDLSYNNFTAESSEQLVCPQNEDVPSSCLSSVHCPKQWYSLHINCGGEVTVSGSKTYEDDTDSAGPAKFFRSKTNWAFRSTGVFMDDARLTKGYIWMSSSGLSVANLDLYMDARISPNSLTYYGFCLANGNYTVNLHFAEIMFTDDGTYSSRGRRVFDVYIQGKRVLKDFNIANEAGGVGNTTVQNFPAVSVDSNILEIHLQWAGKGTTGIPYRGVYGPLISAISVESDFPPPESGSSIHAGVIAAIVAASAFLIVIVVTILWWKGCIGRKAGELKGLDLHTSLFTLRQMKTATNNFDETNKIGEGGFGPVYKGLLLDGTVIAVKQLSSKSRQGNREFINEIGMISALQHPHLVKLYGCCVEGDQLLLVYEYMENNSLARALFGKNELQLKLDWSPRHKICVGVARGLAYLHEESRLKIVHRDIKATNILLDRDLNPKISDFGLAKLDEEENTHISTRIAGTCGYMAPEYAMHGYLTDKADVYSFGIVALEIVSGRNNTTHRPKEECFYLLDWAHLLKEEGGLLELVDSRLGSQFDKEEVMVMINVALLCTNITPALRPKMSSVVSMLEGRTAVEEIVSGPRPIEDEEKLRRMREYYSRNAENTDGRSQTQSVSTEGPWAASSSSASDLYPISNIDYLDKRN